MISEVREIGVTASGRLGGCEFFMEGMLFDVKPWNLGGGERSLFLSFSFKHRSLVIKEYCVLGLLHIDFLADLLAGAS